MDHVGVVARREATKLVIRKIQEMAGNRIPVILTGDFNVDLTDETYRILSDSGILKDAYISAEQRFAENGTFNDFKPDLKTDSRIDHIFLSPRFKVRHYGILTNSYWSESTDKQMLRSNQAPKEIKFGRFIRRIPSDHYPVLVKIEFAPMKK